jgi:hypothetical protein
MALLEVAARGRAVDALALTIVNDAVAARSDAREGVFGHRMHVAASVSGIAFLTDRTTRAYGWSEIERIDVQHRSVVVRTSGPNAATRRFRLVVDEVEEPALSETFASVLEDMRVGSFGRNGTAWIEYQNALETLHRAFAQHDDQFLPSVSMLLWIALGVLASIVVAATVNLAQVHAVPVGMFAIWHRITLLDPRAIIAAFAASSLFTTVVLHVGFGDGALVWMRGAARGWMEKGPAAWRFAVRQLARTLLARSSSAVVLLIALLTFWPNIAATELVGPDGLRNAVLLPFISLDERWRDVVEISQIASTTPGERASVLIRFADGRVMLATPDDLGGGTTGQFFARAQVWRAAAQNTR